MGLSNNGTKNKRGVEQAWGWFRSLVHRDLPANTGVLITFEHLARQKRSYT